MADMRRELDARDKPWVDALRRYLGDGGANTPVPVYWNDDGTVNAQRTVDRTMELNEVKPVVQR